MKGISISIAGNTRDETLVGVQEFRNANPEVITQPLAEAFKDLVRATPGARVSISGSVQFADDGHSGSLSLQLSGSTEGNTKVDAMTTTGAAKDAQQEQQQQSTTTSTATADDKAGAGAGSGEQAAA
jgi:hypothetical protein